ncbi:DNA-binding protein [Halomonas sp. Bachu 37]|uniref:DNA-binding protein n=1 Tax=Halomonas kashgarensis TaxID=3084920 RepID=UPI0032171322
MARSGIQYADVQQAIDTLLARGDAPSVQRIRDVLGTGSFTTINEHLRQWRLEREQNRDVPPPRNVPTEVAALAEGMWREAQQVANQALAHYREEARRQVESAQEAAESSAREAANAEQRQSALAEHLRHTEQRLETLSAELAHSQAQLQQASDELRKSQLQCEQLTESVESEREKRSMLKRDHQQQLEKHDNEWRERLEREEQRHEAAEGKWMGMLDTARQEQTAIEKAAQRRAQQLESKIESLSQSLADARRAQEQSQRLHHATEVSLGEYKEQLVALTRENQRMTDELAARESRMHAQDEAIEKIKEEKARVEQEWQNRLWHSLESLHAQMASVTPDKPSLPTGQTQESSTKEEGKSTD